MEREGKERPREWRGEGAREETRQRARKEGKEKKEWWKKKGESEEARKKQRPPAPLPGVCGHEKLNVKKQKEQV